MKKLTAALLTAVLLLINIAGAEGGAAELEAVYASTAGYTAARAASPKPGSVGGEWAVIGLARGGYDVPDGYFGSYYKALCGTLRENNGVLHDRKYTEYSRAVLAVAAIGGNPADVAGYNLLEPLADYDKTVRQGINGAIFALIAIGSGDYGEGAEVAAAGKRYFELILASQLEDGGFSLSGRAPSEPDVTAMALCALSVFKGTEAADAAADRALAFLSAAQNDDGGYSSFSQNNCESAAQAVIALCALGIPGDDARFVKNGNSLTDNLLQYCSDGGFSHVPGGNADMMAAEQGLCALAAAVRLAGGKKSLYDMTDVTAHSYEEAENGGLADRHSEVEIPPVLYSDKVFSDIESHPCREAVLALAQRGIISGRTEAAFDADSTMTRAELSAVVVRALGLSGSGCGFSDVSVDDWFYEYVSAAAEYGIVNGISAEEFAPGGTITRQEAAVMLTRAARLCGLNTEIDSETQRNILSVFADYTTAADWAAPSLAFCCGNGILIDEETELLPHKNAARAEIAVMLYNVLKRAGLI